MKLSEELGKLFRTIYCYQWGLKDYDVNHDTAYSLDYMTDALNYLATGTQEVSCILDVKDKMDELDDGIALAECMMFNTVELIDEFKEKLDTIENKASKNKII